MNSWMDREKRTFTLLYLACGLLLTAVCFWLGGWTVGLVAFLGSVCFWLLIFWQLHRRERVLQQLARDLDRVLHGAAEVRWEQYAEGELAVLQTEVQKLTLELRDRAAALDEEKHQLADFLADISHQLRTPLTSVSLNLTLLRNPDLPVEQRLQSIRELQRMMQRMDWLINALLKMSKLDSNTAHLQKEPINVHRLVTKAADPLAVSMELRDQRLVLQMEEDVSFLGDPAWSVEAVGNILKNCVEHTPPGGTVTVEAEENALFCQIRIRDTGKGIDPADLPHLFERFYRGKNAGAESIGIGLALARMICAGQNGTLKAENLPEGGAAFTMRFYKSTV
ncbi:MAG: HAMP domain-containing histidine kinase [Clostridia bacterium]|nr:HAMP domain-containing histidine kinase [Clostridia bacterium]